MTTNSRSTVTPQLVIGIFIMVMGALLVLDRLHVVDTSFIRLLWPVALMTVGVSILAQPRDQNGRVFWGSAWTLLGVWLLLNAIGILSVRVWDLLGPALLILLGGALMMRTFRRKAESPSETSSNGTFSMFAFMGGATRVSTDRAFRGGEMTSLLGGCKIDLRQASIAPGEEATIDVFAVMGGHEILVPQAWRVDSDVMLLLGGLDDKRVPLLDPQGQPPTLRLRGFALMGGIEIKNL